MGHLVGKDIFRELGRKIDGLEMRVPWNDTLHAILKELYSEQEADLVVKMPYGLSTLAELERATAIEGTTLRRLLDGLTAKGLVIDLRLHDEFHYAPSPGDRDLRIHHDAHGAERQDQGDGKTVPRIYGR